MNEIRKCPMCNKKMVAKDGVLTCPDCGYRINTNASVYSSGYGSSANDSNSYNTAASSGASASTAGSSNSAAGTDFASRTSTSAQTGSGSNSTLDQAEKKMRASIIAIIAVSAVIAAVIIVIFAVIGNKKEPETDRYAETTAQKQTKKQSSIEAATRKSPMSEANSSAAEEATSPVKTGYRPESDMMIELVELIFEKDLKNITREELDSIVYLDIYDMDNGSVAIYFELADGTSATCSMDSANVDTRDLKCFGGLEYLLLEDESLDYGTDWSSLKNLYCLQVRASIGDLIPVMDVSQLYALILGSNLIGAGDFSKISAYTNLQHLEINAYYTKSLDGLSGAPALVNLYITNGDGIDDFEELYSMPQLEALSIESSKLRDIGFIREMDNLKTLELNNTAVKSIDDIAECADTLTSLHLRQNYSLEFSDYDVVYTCTGLEDLELYVNYDFDIEMAVPDLSMMTELTRLTIGNFDRFDNLKKLTSLKELTICDAYTGDPEALRGLTGLTALTLDDMSLEASFFEPIADMTELVTLDMTDTFYWGDPAAFLKAPNLQSVYLTDASIGLNESTMPISESVQLLDLDGTLFYPLNEDGSWNYNNSGIIDLCDNLYFLSSFPNLIALYVPGHELDDLSFTAGMEQLYYLDISNNYVTDLSPLAGLPSLRVVVCPNNPIHDRTGLDNVLLLE